LLEQQLDGNAEDLSEHRLHARAWPLIAESLEQEKRSTFNDLVESDPGMSAARYTSSAMTHFPARRWRWHASGIDRESAWARAGQDGKNGFHGACV
jgi:hypothetical protein